MSFELDHRFREDCVKLGDLKLCRLLLMNEARFPWCILVPRRAGVREIFELDEADQEQLWREVTGLAREMNEVFGADKMNLAAFGNLVPQLHLHVVARFEEDAAWPGPAIGRFPRESYPPAVLEEQKRKLAPILARLGSL